MNCLAVSYKILRYYRTTIFRVKLTGPWWRIIYAFIVNSNAADGARISDSSG